MLISKLSRKKIIYNVTTVIIINDDLFSNVHLVVEICYQKLFKLIIMLFYENNLSWYVKLSNYNCVNYMREFAKLSKPSLFWILEFDKYKKVITLYSVGFIVNLMFGCIRLRKLTVHSSRLLDWVKTSWSMYRFILYVK